MGYFLSSLATTCQPGQAIFRFCVRLIEEETHEFCLQLCINAVLKKAATFLECRIFSLSCPWSHTPWKKKIACTTGGELAANPDKLFPLLMMGWVERDRGRRPLELGTAKSVRMAADQIRSFLFVPPSIKIKQEQMKEPECMP